MKVETQNGVVVAIAENVKDIRELFILETRLKMAPGEITTEQAMQNIRRQLTGKEQCPRCPRTFKNKRAVSAHIIMGHEGRHFKGPTARKTGRKHCPTCGKMVKHLEMHIRRNHSF